MKLRAEIFLKSILTGSFLFVLLLTYGQHGWSFDDSNYEFSGEVNAVVMMDEVEMNSGSFGVFVGNECRGFTDDTLYFPVTEKYYFSVFCFSNIAAGETMSFKFFNDDDGSVYTIAETIEFTNNMVLGDPFTPLEFHVSFRPVISGLSIDPIFEGSSFSPIPLDDYVHDVSYPDDQITWSFTGNSDLTISINERIVTVTSPGEEWYGSDTVTFTAENPALSTDEVEVIFAILPVNDPPEFTPGDDLSFLVNSGAQNITMWATGLTPGPANESEQLLTFNLSGDNTDLFNKQPEMDSNGTMIFTLATDAKGTANMSVSLSDDGGTENGGADTSDEYSFTISVLPENNLILYYEDEILENKDTIEVCNDPESFDLIVRSAIEWSYESSSSWFTISMKNDSVLTVSMDDNTTDLVRIESIIVSDIQDHEVRFLVKQFSICIPDGVEKQYNRAISIYPNPVSTSLFVHSDLLMDHAKVEILDSKGAKIDVSNRIQTNNNSIHIDLNNYPNGLYFIRVISGNETIVNKFIKHE